MDICKDTIAEMNCIRQAVVKLRTAMNDSFQRYCGSAALNFPCTVQRNDVAVTWEFHFGGYCPMVSNF